MSLFTKRTGQIAVNSGNFGHRHGRNGDFVVDTAARHNIQSKCSLETHLHSQPLTAMHVVLHSTVAVYRRALLSCNLKWDCLLCCSDTQWLPGLFIVRVSPSAVCSLLKRTGGLSLLIQKEKHIHTLTVAPDNTVTPSKIQVFNPDAQTKETNARW